MSDREMRAALEECREALRKAHDCATFDALGDGKCMGCFVSQALASADAALAQAREGK